MHPSPGAMTSNEFDARLNKLLSSHLKNPSLTPKKTPKTSRSAAKVAVKVVRATIEEKTAIIKENDPFVLDHMKSTCIFDKKNVTSSFKNVHYM